jgi:hypothetical protein
MTSGVFVIHKDGSGVQELKQQDFEKENILQKLLNDYPKIIAGNLINESKPRKWLSIDREYGIPDKEDSGDRWSIDHLFLDQDAIPTLIEVKRSTDTRLRREVIGQLLEYAANAVQYWDAVKLQAIFEGRCRQKERDPQDELLKILDREYDEYWESVKTNLETGKIRLLLVSDEIPFETRSIVEFLNEKMNDVEVLAFEIKKYAGLDYDTLIPRVYGQTSKAVSRKSKPLPTVEEHLDKIKNEEVKNMARDVKNILLEISSDIREVATTYHIVYKKGGRNIVRVYPQTQNMWLDIYIPIEEISVYELEISQFQHISHFKVDEKTNQELIRKALQRTYDHLFNTG